MKLDVEPFLAETIAALLTLEGKVQGGCAADKIARRIRTVLLLSPACKLKSEHVMEAARLILIEKDKS